VKGLLKTKSQKVQGHLSAERPPFDGGKCATLPGRKTYRRQRLLKPARHLTLGKKKHAHGLERERGNAQDQQQKKLQRNKNNAKKVRKKGQSARLTGTRQGGESKNPSPQTLGKRGKVSQKKTYTETVNRLPKEVPGGRACAGGKPEAGTKTCTE